MKKSFLLIAAGLIAGFANAQEAQNSILFNTHPSLAGIHGQPVSTAQREAMHNLYMQRMASKHLGAKTTSSSVSDWYDLWDQNQGASPLGYYFAVFPDSNATNTDGGTGLYPIGIHGMGMSFDPTDSSYFSTVPTLNGGALSIPVSQEISAYGQDYTVDSFYVPVSYQRLDPSPTTVDSLVIELVTAIDASGSTEDTGAYNLQYQTADASFLPYAMDEMPRFGTIRYNSGTKAPYNVNPYINDCYFDSVFIANPYKQRFAIPLTAAAAADTTNGLLNLGHLLGGAAGQTAIHLASGLTLTTGSHEHLVSYVSFKSGNTGGTYPLGTTAANWIKLFAGSPLSGIVGGTTSTLGFTQASGNAAIGYNGSYQASLVATNQIRYNDTAFTFPSGIHDVLIPASAYSDPATGFEVVEQSFHITWSATPSLGVQNVNNSLNNIVAYPNPATNVLNITYSASTVAPVTVTLTNMVGQIVATQSTTNGKASFNTANLASGVYVYSLEVNGTRTTGRVAIAH